jgi:hypothetical protein
MSYKYFVFIEKVIGNHLTSFIIKEAYYLTIVKLNVIDLTLPLVSRIDSCKHLISRI